MPLIDISPTLHAGIAVWPGDVGYARTVTCAFEGGANLDLSSVQTTVHVGAHADAPSHYHPDGSTIEKRDLDRYYGPCQVMRVRVPAGERVRPEHLTSPIVAPRLLLCTGSYPDPTEFNEDFASLSPELVSFIAKAGVRLVGIDTPSVDPYTSKTLESHNAIYAHDMAVLEGLVLDHVAEGLYTLVALPLKLAGADASPVRAALMPR